MSHSHGGGGGCCSHTGDENDDELGAQNSLFTKINLDQVQCLNELVDGSGKEVFKPWDQRFDTEHFVVSADGENLLFNVPFLGNVKLMKLHVLGAQDDSHPSQIRLYKNRPGMKLEEVNLPSHERFGIINPPVGIKTFNLNETFSSCFSVTIHISRNFGSKNSKVYYIGLCGQYISDFSLDDSYYVRTKEFLKREFYTHKITKKICWSKPQDFADAEKRIKEANTAKIKRVKEDEKFRYEEVCFGKDKVQFSDEMEEEEMDKADKNGSFGAITNTQLSFSTGSGGGLTSGFSSPTTPAIADLGHMDLQKTDSSELKKVQDSLTNLYGEMRKIRRNLAVLKIRQGELKEFLKTVANEQIKEDKQQEYDQNKKLEDEIEMELNNLHTLISEAKRLKEELESRLH